MASLNHIGVAVKDLSRMKQLFALLGLHVTHEEDVLKQGVKTHFLKLPLAQTQIELLEITDPDGTVSKYVQKRGPGVHHLSFEVKKGELLPLSGKLSQEGFKLIYDTPRSGAHQMLVNFIHPATAGGILIEIMEPEN